MGTLHPFMQDGAPPTCPTHNSLSATLFPVLSARLLCVQAYMLPFWSTAA